MKMTILLIGVLAAAGCSTPNNKVDNTVSATPMDHNTMDHSKMDHGNMNSGGGHSMESSPNAAAAPYDLQFLDTMIAHHQGAVGMATPAASKAEHSEIKTLAANITASQNQEVAQMKEWREKWFSGAAPAINMAMPGMADGMTGMDMKKLDEASGVAFDLLFIKQMIPHHEGAVVMAKEALEHSTKPEIKKLAEAVIKAQEAEIAQMKTWQSLWSK